MTIAKLIKKEEIDMGMYTELVIKCALKRSLPDDANNVLKYLFGDADESPINLPEHNFFKRERWKAIGRSNSYYHIPGCCNFYDGYYLFSRSDLKDYDQEIENFLDWIDPYITGKKGGFIGWEWHEGWHQPDFIYKKGE